MGIEPVGTVEGLAGRGVFNIELRGGNGFVSDIPGELGVLEALLIADLTLVRGEWPGLDYSPGVCHRYGGRATSRC